MKNSDVVQLTLALLSLVIELVRKGARKCINPSSGGSEKDQPDDDYLP